jgi:lysyl-tRNA synthetase class 2
VAERFELYIAGVELCNGFSELTDPIEQRKRFEAEQETRKAGHKPVYPMPQNFLAALNDMPAACGNALGIDRLVMLFADTRTIDDVVAFVPEEL